MPCQSLPNPKTLAKEFSKEVWEAYGNVTSEPLLKAWEQIFDTFNKCIERNLGGVEPVKQQVLALPTGSGKTTASCYYLDRLEGVGALVITAFKDEADNIRDSFRNWSKVSCYHSDSRISGADIDNSQVLIITHSQYINRIRDDNLSKFNYKGQSRPLVIIDESIANINCHTIDESDVNTLISNLKLVRDDALKLKLPVDEEIAYLEDIKGMFNEVAEKVDSSQGVHLTKEHVVRIRYNPTALQVIKTYLGERRGALEHVINSTSFDQLREVYNKIISASHNPSLFFSKPGIKLLLNTSEYVRIDHAHTVVLDATATVDKVYDLRDGVEVLPPPDGVRDYSNVTLYVSAQDYSLGSNSLKSNMGKVNDESSVAHHVIKFLEGQFIFSSEKTLFVTSQKVEKEMAFLDDIDPLVRDGLEQEHWGNITGKNNYSECSSIVILGFNFKSEHHISNLHLTTRTSDQAIMNFDDAGAVSSEVKDERKAIKAGNISAEVVQAINRVRCRKVKDGGSCEPTKVFLYKWFNKDLFDTVISSIEKQMPGIQIEESDQMTLPDSLILGSSASGGRPPLNVRKLLQQLDEYDGDYPILFPNMARDAEIPRNSHKGLREQLTNPDHESYKMLASRGLEIIKGAGRRAYEIQLVSDQTEKHTETSL